MLNKEQSRKISGVSSFEKSKSERKFPSPNRDIEYCESEDN
jgi:hypothetical protein